MATRPTLAELCQRGHENNFNAIRLIAALAVIVAHGFPLTGRPDPWIDATGLAIGTFAVDIFFLTSGFLVTMSLLVRQDLTRFVVARLMRIYPGLMVMTALTVLVAGAVIGAHFFSDPGTGRYALQTSLISMKKLTVYELPGVFYSNPYPRVVNGSLWTLPFELRMYGLLAAGWLLLSLVGRNRLRFMKLAIVGLAVAAWVAKWAWPDSVSANFVFMFFCGGSYYVLRRRIPIRGDVAVACALLILATAASRPLFSFVYPPLIGYLLFAASYLPTLWRPRNDYSYGTYIYAFPVQQCVALLIPGVSWVGMTALASPVVLLLAVASWHLVEKPCMTWTRGFHRTRPGPGPVPG